jgi:diguanylate cyclase (GGDEF)-like protein
MTILTTKQIIFRIALIVSIVEFSIMLLLGDMHNNNTLIIAIIDIVLLAIFSTPLILFTVVKPFVLEKNKTSAKLHHLAQTDQLTQLPNRRCIREHLDNFIANAARAKMHGAALLLDLDGFKRINDVHGHNAGDCVLVEVSRRIQASLRSNDVVGRLGGDEFIILLNHLNADKKIASEMAVTLAEQLIANISQPISYKQAPLTVGASVGVRLFGFESLKTVTVMIDADHAMYQAKKSGKGCCVLFN